MAEMGCPHCLTQIRCRSVARSFSLLDDNTLSACSQIRSRTSLLQSISRPQSLEGFQSIAALLMNEDHSFVVPSKQTSSLIMEEGFIWKFTPLTISAGHFYFLPPVSNPSILTAVEM